MGKIITSICYPFLPPKILLGMKKRAFGEGRWNGFGGKVQPGETLEQSVHREVEEECGIIIKEMEWVGVMDFEYPGENKIMEVNVFKILKFEGEPAETEEMRPKWFDISELPFDLMWPDDKFWMPLFFQEKKFKGTFKFKGFDKIIDYQLSEIN